jgi:hypothetical protein
MTTSDTMELAVLQIVPHTKQCLRLLKESGAERSLDAEAGKSCTASCDAESGSEADSMFNGSWFMPHCCLCDRHPALGWPQYAFRACSGPRAVEEVGKVVLQHGQHIGVVMGEPGTLSLVCLSLGRHERMRACCSRRSVHVREHRRFAIVPFRVECLEKSKLPSATSTRTAPAVAPKENICRSSSVRLRQGNTDCYHFFAADYERQIWHFGNASAIQKPRLVKYAPWQGNTQVPLMWIAPAFSQRLALHRT